jgi:hypothetical protein
MMLGEPASAVLAFVRDEGVALLVDRQGMLVEQPRASSSFVRRGVRHNTAPVRKMLRATDAC